MHHPEFSSLAELQRYEYEARRLRAQHAHDLSLRLVLGLDAWLRRAARRIAAALGSQVSPCR